MSLADFSRHMAQALEDFQARGIAFGRPDLMAQQVHKMAEKGASSSEVQNRDRIAEALAMVRKGALDDALATHLRYLCWGLSHSGPSGSILSNPALCQPVLREIGNRSADLTLSAWRGLLESYLTAPADVTEGEGASGWIALRSLLRDSLPGMLAKAKFQPEWLQIMDDHRNLLSEHPCDRYAGAVLSGDGETVASLQTALAIPPDSWFWTRLILSQVTHAASLNDAEFVPLIDRLLKVLTGHKMLYGEALKVLLPRYHASLAAQPHGGLQGLAVAAWGSPNIYSQAKWNLVAPEVKQMVQEWLVRQDLHDFFSVLSDDPDTDRRRLDYWLRFAKQIDFVRISLGGFAANRKTPDYVDMRARMKDRYCRLVGGQSANNAFIMRINDVYFVEFSQTGNAAYGYAEGRLPFRLDTSEIDRPALLDMQSKVFRETHGGDWEAKFDEVLATTHGIYPDVSGRQQRQATHAVRSQSSPPKPKPVPPKDVPFERHAFLALVARYRIRYEDNTPKGGAIWAYHLKDDEAAELLKGMGFRLAPARGWWRRL